MTEKKNRCAWVNVTNPLYVAYHDEEWGRPLRYNDQKLFELLMLECYQAGLSWELVLKKRAAFRQAFYDYDVEKVAQMTDEELESLLANPDLIRHRGKIFATRQNAQAFLKIVAAYGDFDDYLWHWVGYQPQVNPVTDYRQAPSQTELSQALSKDLKKRGFKFTGPIAIYSYMQAVGMVNDHEDTCDWK